MWSPDIYANPNNWIHYSNVPKVNYTQLIDERETLSLCFRNFDTDGDGRGDTVFSYIRIPWEIEIICANRPIAVWIDSNRNGRMDKDGELFYIDYSKK